MLLVASPSCPCVYSANVMTAAVYGRHSLDELQQLVVDAFSPVEDQQLPVPSFSPDVFCDEVGFARDVDIEQTLYRLPSSNGL